MSTEQPTAEDPKARTKGVGRSPFWVWTERAVWVFVAVMVFQRFGPQLGAAVGVGSDLGTMPSFQVTTLDGEVIHSDDLRGKVVLVNFWATWCGPCRVEMPGFQRVFDDWEAEGFVLLGLTTDRVEESVVRAWLEERDLDYPVARSTAEIEQAFGGLRGLPTSFLVDRDGQIRNRVYGFFAPPALRLAVRNLVRSETEMD